MLHPFMPFVTEEIYQAIPHLEESICISKYPTVNPDFNDENINRQFTYLMDIVKGVREIRANYTIKNAIEVEYSIETKDENLQACNFCFSASLSTYAPSSTINVLPP